MAKIELASGKSPELKKMAKGIIASQTKEIAHFDKWLKKARSKLAILASAWDAPSASQALLICCSISSNSPASTQRSTYQTPSSQRLVLQERQRLCLH